MEFTHQSILKVGLGNHMPRCFFCVFRFLVPPSVEGGEQTFTLIPNAPFSDSTTFFRPGSRIGGHCTALFPVFHRLCQPRIVGDSKQV